MASNQFPVSQQNATNNGTSSSTIPPASNPQAQVDTALANRLGVQTPNSNTTNGSMDLTQRKSQLSSQDSQGSKKVALVGRYGGGTTNTWGDATQASGSGSTTLSTVVFKTTPQLTESGTVSAVDIGEIRSAGSVIVYLGSPSRTFNITAKFVSTTQKEADENWRYINILKAWRMPQSNSDEPETIRLFAYDQTLKGIPCLLMNIGIEWSDDVDYITASNGSPVPIIQQVTLSLKEVRNYDDINKFDYVSFKSGSLQGW